MDQQCEWENLSADVVVISTTRKAYVSPSLLEYGNVAKLTQTGTGSITDMNGNMSMNAFSAPGSSGPAKMR